MKSKKEFIEKINKGEIVYCNLKVEYIRSNYYFKKIFIKTMNKFILARPYDCNTFPILDVVKYSMLINKIDKKNAYYISNVKIVNLDILERTGYIHRYETIKTRKLKRTY